ncbi:MAG TPA: acyl-CoA synthetase FdrA [Symbiobacteriaceae bacterium]|nr:acyl-CoA synthetase FdrA [Symbiobacteriaceae bacterium]
MPIRWLVKPGSYYDSVSLMQLSSKAAATPGVRAATAMMATPMNLDTMAADGLLVDELKGAGPNDLIMVVDAAEAELAESVLASLNESLNVAPAQNADSQTVTPRSSAEAKAAMADANVALISVPGTYAAYEAAEALRLGMHVHMFSDNVTVEQEVALKQYAAKRGLLVMGPDCGTAIINGTPLAFANVVRRGPIGVVGASGTGIQAITVLIDRLGGGLSHAIGTGGRDLKDDVGGIMFLAGIEAMEADASTEVIVLVSKPPGKQTMQKVLERLRNCSKPVVVCLLRGGKVVVDNPNVYPVTDLEEAARVAVALTKGQPIAALTGDDATTEQLKAAAAKFTPAQKYLRGLYSGGTLCDETMLVLRDLGVHTYSNTPIEDGYQLENARISREHTVVDLGDDEFTRGKPHPMIDPSQRAQRLVQEMADPSVAVIMLDVVLGYGSNADPAGAMAKAIATGKAARTGGEVLFIASVCGTEADPQKAAAQEAILRQAGALVYPSNTAAAKAAASVLLALEGRECHV